MLVFGIDDPTDDAFVWTTGVVLRIAIFVHELLIKKFRVLRSCLPVTSLKGNASVRICRWTRGNKCFV